MKADEPPRRAMPTATLAGAPPGAFLNAGASANERPLAVGKNQLTIPQSKPQGTTHPFRVPHYQLAMLYLMELQLRGFKK